MKSQVKLLWIKRTSLIISKEYYEAETKESKYQEKNNLAQTYFIYNLVKIERNINKKGTTS